jgi:hypothetical protein
MFPDNFDIFDFDEEKWYQLIGFLNRSKKIKLKFQLQLNREEIQKQIEPRKIKNDLEVK